MQDDAASYRWRRWYDRRGSGRQLGEVRERLVDCSAVVSITVEGSDREGFSEGDAMIRAMKNRKKEQNKTER
jgi:hypothetical protein